MRNYYFFMLSIASFDKGGVSMREERSSDQTMPVDFHSHILPALDDGSQNEQQTLAMLLEARRQGTQVMVATPHFYPESESPDAFLARRAEAVDRLLVGGYDPAVHPRICVGAEVAYFRGIGRCEDLRRLCIVGTNAVLIEMPFGYWTDSIFEDVCLVRSRMGLTPILAHIERYRDMNSASMRRMAVQNGCYLQINASMMNGMMSRRRALRMLASGEVQLLGSDCHNMTTRPPGMQHILSYVREHAGAELISQMAECNRFLLRGVIPIERLSTACSR